MEKSDTLPHLYLEDSQEHTVTEQGKPTYTVAKAYRVTSLLSCFDRVIERVVATWVASCETNEVFYREQFGCRGGRGTSVAKFENAWSQKRTALALILDVNGAFDRVNKKHLIKRMVQVDIAGNIVPRVDSFCVEQRGGQWLLSTI